MPEEFVPPWTLWDPEGCVVDQINKQLAGEEMDVQLLMSALDQVGAKQLVAEGVIPDPHKAWHYINEVEHEFIVSDHEDGIRVETLFQVLADDTDPSQWGQGASMADEATLQRFQEARGFAHTLHEDGESVVKHQAPEAPYSQN